MAKQLATYGVVTSKSLRKKQTIDEIPPGYSAENTIKRSTLVFVGDANIAANSPVKGYVRTPIRRFVKILSIYADVVKVREWGTTKNCHKCHSRVVVSKSPHRFVQCPQCKKVILILVGQKTIDSFIDHSSICFYFFFRQVWNRDTHAAQNICDLGLLEMEKKERKGATRKAECETRRRWTIDQKTERIKKYKKSF